MNRKPNVDDFVKGFYKGIKKMGVANFVKKFNHLHSRYAENGEVTPEKIGQLFGTQEVIKIKILDEVSYLYGVSTKDITHTRKRGKTMEARFMAIVLLRSHLNLSYKEIEKVFLHEKKSQISKKLIVYSKKANGRRIGVNEEYSKYMTDRFFENIKVVDATVNKFLKEQNKGQHS